MPNPNKQYGAALEYLTISQKLQSDIHSSNKPAGGDPPAGGLKGVPAPFPGDAARRDEEMDVRVVGESAGPGVQHSARRRD